LTTAATMKPLVLLSGLIPLIALALLGSAPAVAAKEMTVEVCGAADCVTVSDPGRVGSLHSTGAPSTSPEPAPFYVVRFRSQDDPRTAIAGTYLDVPRAREMRGDEFGSGPVHWMTAPFLDPLLAELTADLEPYPSSPTWTPTAAAPERGHSIGWGVLVALALAAAAAIALALRWVGRSRLGRRAIGRA
jgi:hypothetical protein